MIKADRPLMKLIEGGISSYDIDVLFQNSPVTTAFEMLGRLPGMAMEGEDPVLMGTNGYTLILNGKPSSIPQKQLLEMLKTIPVQMVANVEISYAPIARYKAKGASINIILKTQSKDKQLRGVPGQLFANYYNEFYDTYSGGGNISYNGKGGWAFNGSYKGTGGKSYSNMIFDAQPFGSNDRIAVNNVGVSKYTTHTLFTTMTNDFRLSQKQNIVVGLNATFIHGGMQGFYDFGDMFNLSASAKWTSQSQKWSIALQAKDLLNRAIPRVKANYGIHKFNFEPMNFNRSISLDVRYTFGGFKTTKKPTPLITDRFGM